MGETLYLGTSKVDITPNFPVELAGFASREGMEPSDTVARRLYAKCFVFQSERERERTTAVLISADLLWWGPDREERLRRNIGERWGLDGDSILLHATHTHSGPQTSSRFLPAIGQPHSGYIVELEQRVLEAVGIALNNPEPVSIECGEGSCRIGIHRRRRSGSRIVLAPNDDGPVDPQVRVVRFRRLNGGDTKAVLVHYACHPTITSANRITSEFCGAAMERVERESGSQAVAAYLQGCCGDIGPISVKDGAFVDGRTETVDLLGAMLAEEALRILREPMTILEAVSPRVRAMTVRLPLEKLPTKRELESAALEPGVRGAWGRLLLSRQERLSPYIPLTLSLLSIADRLSFLAMNAEMVVEYGNAIKRLSNGNALPLAYSNGMIGYVTTASQSREGGYEPEESTLYFGLPSPLRPETESIVMAAIGKLLRSDSGPR